MHLRTMGPCTMGVGCDEAGACYAEVNGEPEQCPLHQRAVEIIREHLRDPDAGIKRSVATDPHFRQRTEASCKLRGVPLPDWWPKHGPELCLDCKGSGAIRGVVGQGPEGYEKDFTCVTCDGTGEVPAVGLQPCRSPYCECTPGQCTHPGCYDARGTQP